LLQNKRVRCVFLAILTQVGNTNVAETLSSPFEACLANLPIDSVVDRHFRLECEVATRLCLFFRKVVNFPASVYLSDFESI
jgi:hypothetical protein